MTKRLLLALILFRCFNAISVQTFWSPDEYWQSLEVASQWVYGRGYLTWEWCAETRIRSVLHVGQFAVIFKLLQVSGLDQYYRIFIYGPKVYQGLWAAFSDYFTFKLALLVFGADVAEWTLIASLCSWFNWYASTRTFVNSWEMSMIAITMYQWIKALQKRSDFRCFNFPLALGALLAYIRPTAALFFLPLAAMTIYEIFLYRGLYSGMKFALRGSLISIMCLACGIAADSFMLGHMTISPLNFFKMNVMNNIASSYGTHSVHWYFSQGVPTLLATYLIPFATGLHSVANERHPFRKYAALIFIVVLLYSILSHKEFRFIQFLLPTMLIIVGNGLNKIIKSNTRAWLAIVFIPQIIMSLFFGSFHQPGVVSVLSFLNENTPVLARNQTILFAMPCHSTPLYSHINRNDLNLEFLTCHPKSMKLTSCFRDEHLQAQDIFYQDPVAGLSGYPRPIDTLIVFEQFLQDERVNDYIFNDAGFEQIASFYNSLFIDDDQKRGKVIVLRKPIRKIP